MKKSYLIVILVLIVIVLFVVLRGNKSEAPTVIETEETILQEETEELSDAMPVLDNQDVSEMIVGEVKEFNISGKNFSFDPSTITVKKGDRVKITFNNTQGFHDFVIDEYGAATKKTQAPTQEVIEFTADKVGSFEYYCSVGSHRQMGMKGTLNVVE